MTKQTDINDRDGLKELATELGLEYPANIPTNKLIDQIKEKIEEDSLTGILLMDGEELVFGSRAVVAMNMARASEDDKEHIFEKVEMLPLDALGKFTFKAPEKFVHDDWARLDGIETKLKDGIDGKKHNLSVRYYFSGTPDDAKMYEFDGENKMVDFMLPKGNDLVFEVTATAFFDTTVTVPDPEGEEGATKEEVKEEERAILVDEYFESALLDISYFVEKEKEDNPDPKPDPEPSEVELVRGLNTIHGFQFEYMIEQKKAFLQISDSLLIELKRNKNIADTDLVRIGGDRLLSEHKFLKEIIGLGIDFDIFDSRFNNVITKEQFEKFDYYQDLENGNA